MVLSSFGLDIAEAELRVKCDCTVFGTDALKTVDAARQLGFNGTAKHTLSLPEIESALSGGHGQRILLRRRAVSSYPSLLPLLQALQRSRSARESQNRLAILASIW